MPEFIVSNLDVGKRIDKFICEKAEISRSLCKDCFEKNLITVNNKTVKQSYQVKENDVIFMEEFELEEYEIIPEDLNLEYVYDDMDLCVVNKPSGMVVHPAPGALYHTLVHGLMYDLKDSLSGINGLMRPGIVHRIDKDTSGLLVIAKNDFAHNGLSLQLQAHTVVREYIALVNGIIPNDLGRINAPIGRDPIDRMKMSVVKDGKEAITNFKVLKRYKDKTLVACRLETGRTHQIRVHFKYIGYPLVGDPLYGTRKVVGDNGQFLHAHILGFIHPRSNEYMEFKSELPDYYQEYIKELENEMK
jgi:23S rRNA pseudouridine1911/1915/1917 synthase